MAEDKKDFLENSEMSENIVATNAEGDKVDSPEMDIETTAKNTDQASPFPQTPDLPLSQAALDLENLESEGATVFGSDNDTKPEKVKPHTARLRWIILMVLSLLGTISFAAEAFWVPLPYKWIGLVLLIISLILNFGAYRFLSLPTRAGLSSFIWSWCFFAAALYGPSEKMFGLVPASLSLAILLILIGLWLICAIGRRIGLNRKAPSMVLWVLTLYALLAPVFAIIFSLLSSNLDNMLFSDLSSAPGFLTLLSPWFLWPMTFVLIVFLPLATFFALWDQVSVLKKGPLRHGGNFFLALSFIILMPYIFFTYEKATTNLPSVANSLRHLPLISDNSPANLPEATAPVATVLPADEANKQPAPQETTVSEPVAPLIPAPPAIEENEQATPNNNTADLNTDKVQRLEAELKEMKNILEQQASTIEALKSKLESPQTANQPMEPTLPAPTPPQMQTQPEDGLLPPLPLESEPNPLETPFNFNVPHDRT